MTSASEQATPLSDVDEWLKGLTDEQIALLRLFQDSKNLSLLVGSIGR